MINLPEIVVKPWGYELIWANTDKYLGKILHINKDNSLSLQFHEEKDETIYVLSGTIKLQLEDESILLRTGQGYRIYPKIKHRMTALVDSEVLEASTAHPNDVIRLEDDYNRV